METAAQAVVRVPQADDVGARTADLYDWQAAMAAADGLSMFLEALDDVGNLAPDTTDRIICEHHEDWTALRGPDAELVSAKHREPASGAWTTVSQLVDDGGLAHLFGRWLALDRKPTARLVTCAALANGDPRHLITAAEQLREGREVTSSANDGDSIVHKFAKSLMFYRKGLPEYWHAPPNAVARSYEVGPVHVSEACDFLRVLAIHDDRPQRRFIGHAAPSMYIQPILDRLGRPEVPAQAVWEAVLQIFRIRMRGHGPIDGGELPAVFTTVPGSMDESALDATQMRQLAQRTVSVHDIAVTLRSSIRNPLGYLPLTPPARLTKLSVKMARGGCADVSIERAEQLHIEYKRYWRSRRDNLGGGRAEQLARDRRLMRIADQVTGETRSVSGHWGTSLWSALSDRLGGPDSDTQASEVEGELDLGGVCDLAARCHVWFSPRFDVDAEIARLRTERAA